MRVSVELTRRCAEMPANERMLATVAILTFNGARYLERILEAVSRQQIEGDFEILVVDSGSTDSTLQIVSRFPRVRLHEIPNHEFGHGRTRNLAAKLAHGRYIAYLTHDAVPLGTSWLRELLAPFAIDPKVVGVMGKQVPRPQCFPLLKYEINGAFARFGPDFGTTILYHDDFVRDEATRAALTFYSDVNSAARRDVLLKQIPYRDVRYAEDQLFGQDVIAAGLHKAYAPRAAVEHSNDLTLREFGARIFDETVGLRQIGVVVPPLSWLGQWRRILRSAGGDTLRILRDPSYFWARKVHWLAVNPAFHVVKWASYRRATRIDLGDDAAIQAGSLEHQRKTSHGVR